MGIRGGLLILRAPENLIGSRSTRSPWCRPLLFPIPSLDSAKRDSANFGNVDGKSSAKCKFCVHANVIITERIGTKSNFIRHLDVTQFNYYNYLLIVLLLSYVFKLSSESLIRQLLLLFFASVIAKILGFIQIIN